MLVHGLVVKSVWFVSKDEKVNKPLGAMAIDDGFACVSGALIGVGIAWLSRPSVRNFCSQVSRSVLMIPKYANVC